MTVITLGVDGRPETEAAIRWAAARAALDGSEVRLVSVATDDGPLRDVAFRAIEAASRSFERLAPGVGRTTEVPGGNVFDILLALSEDTDLLVVGSDRPGPLAAALHATLPLRLAGRVASDLAVVPSTWRPEPLGGVVVGWSPDPAGQAALELAAAEAEMAGMRLTIVHAWRPPATSPYDAESAGALVAAAHDDAQRELQDARRIAHERFPRLEVDTELHVGSTRGGLVHAARGAALLVVGDHHRSALGEVVFGSTGDPLIASAHDVPVMIAAGSRAARRIPRTERTPS